MKRWIIIPARYKSKRLHGKVLMDIQGKPMVVRVWEQAMQVPNAEVVVATNDPEIADVVHGYGGTTCWTSEQNRNGMERVAEAAREIETDLHDIVMNLQADMPFIPVQMIEDVLNSTPPFGVVTAVTKQYGHEDEYKNPHKVKVIVTENMQAKYFSRAPIPYYVNPNQTVVWWEHIGLYSMTNKVLQAYAYRPYSTLENTEHLEQLRFYEMQVPISVREYKDVVSSINTQEDYDAIQVPVSNINWPEHTVGHVI